MDIFHRYRFHDSKTGGALHIRVQPGSRKNEIVEILADGTIKIRISAPALEGKANHALIEFLSQLLKVKQSSIEIVAGLRTKDKLVSITNITIDQIESVIHEAVD